MTRTGKSGSDRRTQPSLEVDLTASEVKSRAIRGVSSLYLRQVFMRALGFIGMLVLARILTPEIFGIFAIASFVIHFLEEISRLGLSAALIRKKLPVTQEELSTAFTLQLLMTLLLSAALYLFTPLLTAHYELENDMMWLFRVLGFVLLLTAFKSMPSILLERQLRHDLLAVAEVGEYIVYQVVAIGLALAGFEVWALVAATLARGISGVAIFNYLAWWRPRLGIDMKAAREILAFGIPILITSFGSLANNAIVPVIIGTSLGATAVGYVNFASKSMNAVAWQPLILLGKVQLRVFSTIQDDIVKLKRILEMSLFIGSSITFLLGSALLSIAEPLITIVVGEKWLPSLTVIYLTTGGYILLAILTPYIQALKALGDAITPMLFSYLLLFLQILFIISLIGEFELLSYAIAYSLAYLLAAPYVIWKTHRMVAPKVLTNVLPPLISAIISGFSAYYGYNLIGGLTGMFSGLLINAVVFVILLALLRGDQLGNRLHDVTQSIKPSAINNDRKLLSRICRLLNKLHYRNILGNTGETRS